MATLSTAHGTSFEVDDEDLEFLSDYKFYRYCNKIRAKSKTPDSKPTQRYLGCLLMNPPKGFYVDYIDGNPMNCKRSNLKLIPISKAHRYKRNYKGVHYNKEKGSFKAVIKAFGKKFEFGPYKTELEAAEAYNEQAFNFFGHLAELHDLEDEYDFYGETREEIYANDYLYDTPGVFSEGHLSIIVDI